MTNTDERANTDERLAICFANVFPKLKPDEIPSASVESLTAWDSVAHITLLSAISEEFGVEFDPEDFEELTSFRSIADCLRSRAPA